jgi:hypothetical protein
MSPAWVRWRGFLGIDTAGERRGSRTGDRRGSAYRKRLVGTIRRGVPFLRRSRPHPTNNKTGADSSGTGFL